MRHALAIAVLIGAVTACSRPNPPSERVRSWSEPVETVGRYVIVHSPHVESDTVLLDTATGKSWAMVNDELRNAIIWRPLARGDNTAEYEQWLKDNPEPKNSNPEASLPPWARSPESKGKLVSRKAADLFPPADAKSAQNSN